MGERPYISSYSDKWVASFRPMLSSGKHDTLVLPVKREAPNFK